MIFQYIYMVSCSVFVPPTTRMVWSRNLGFGIIHQGNHAIGEARIHHTTTTTTTTTRGGGGTMEQGGGGGCNAVSHRLYIISEFSRISALEVRPCYGQVRRAQSLQVSCLLGALSPQRGKSNGRVGETKTPQSRAQRATFQPCQPSRGSPSK